MINVQFPDNKVYFIDIRKQKDGIQTPGITEKINEKIQEITRKLLSLNGEKNALLKVHVGEPVNDTHMKPEILKSFIDFFQEKGIEHVYYGDTTVAYSGERGFKENPENNVTKYLNLVKKNGFTDVPFIVLDRPVSAVEHFRFEKIHYENTVEDERIRYKKIYLSGGFLASDIIINNAHLTGHLIAMNALCNKSISMGLGSYAAKIQLHQNLYPEINHSDCIRCEACIENCPVSALSMKNSRVEVRQSVCMGCGECASVCPEGVIHMTSNGISDWNKGTESLDVRMAEYTIAMLSFYHGKMLHVGHLYSITGMCDCMNTHQKPNCRDIGIVIGLNPFAVDFAGAALEGMMKAGDDRSFSTDSMLEQAKKSKRFALYDYVKNTFSIDYEPEMERIEIS